MSGFGADEEYSVGVNDLRFYVSNLAFYDQYGEEIEMTLDDSDFQLNHEEGFVGLIDLTSNTSGTCISSGTERTNAILTGSMLDTGVSKVTFDIGVPQAVMKDVIATSSAEDAPSPLNEMNWPWASGYRHFLMNFIIENTSALTGGGFLHIGSKGCGSTDGLLALEDKDSCDFVNTPQVELTDFDPSINTVVIDIDQLLTDVTFSSISDDDEATEQLSANCHSQSPTMQPNCAPIFSNLGLDTDDGTAVASDNKVVTFQ
ncbi:metallo-mystery pair system four-Cys motif protein [Psychrosphaera saromensis]|uniref:Metallo-mystery pair system four-Cys motif protein n=1 Tax=Psychrosphaera saromensis TaxID=716813 RepID=A0A2S7UZI1_9GAMM|nr:metallo-mystery pair system four-Cys motif protein [Psychrosphaera saromensis]